MSGKKQRVPLDLFLSGMLGPSQLGEKDHPVIVVDESKRRSFMPAGNNRMSARSHSNSSFCSSVTSCSFGDTGTTSFQEAAAAVVSSRWDSMPSSSRNCDKKLRAPTRDNRLKRPSRTRTNDLNSFLIKMKKTPSKKQVIVPKRNSFASVRRIKSMHCDVSMRSKERATKIHASI